MGRKGTGKRANENTPLGPSIRNLNHKALISHIQSAIRVTQSTFGTNSNAPNRPKKMRTSSGLSHGAKQAFEKSKRRNDVKNRLRFRMKTEAKPTDVEMADGTTPVVQTRPLLLPQELPRPDFKEINFDLLKAIAPEVADTNFQYLEDCMSFLGPEMLKSLCSVKIENVSNVLHKEMTVTVNEKTEILPSHILAICAPIVKTEVPTGKPRPVTLYPVHTLVLAMQCAHLPTPPPMLPVPPMPANPQDPQQIQLPVMSISIPSPQTYPQLSHYLYTKQLPYLIRSLIPSTPPRTFLEVPEQGERYASHLASTFRPELIVKHVHIVHGLWQNMCALGIYDDQLWCAIEALWRVMVRALTLSVGEPTVVPLAPMTRATAPQASSSSSSTSTSSESSEQSGSSAPATPDVDAKPTV